MTRTQAVSLTNDALLAMIGHRDVRAEILRRVEALGNTVNLLVFRFLWPLDKADKDDAWEGLAACCWRAKGNLLIPRRMDGRKTTEQAIWDSLAQRLALHRKSGKRIIAQLALGNGFRWTARLVRNDLADYMRALFRGQRRRGRPPIPPAPQPDNSSFLKALLLANRARFLSTIGEKWLEILTMLANAMPLGSNRRAWKSEATRLIAAKRDVSRQQARSDKKRMLYLAGGEPVIEDTVNEILSGPFVSRENSANRFYIREASLDKSGRLLPAIYSRRFPREKEKRGCEWRMPLVRRKSDRKSSATQRAFPGLDLDGRRMRAPRALAAASRRTSSASHE